MSKLSYLQGRSKIFQIGEIELELKPLKLDDLNLFIIGENATQKEQTELSLKLIDKVLKESVSDSTEEERKNIGMEYMEPLMEAIMEINGLKNQKRSGLDAIRTRQEASQIKSQSSR